MTIAPDGRTIYTGHEDGIARIDTASNAVTDVTLFDESDIHRSLAGVIEDGRQAYLLIEEARCGNVAGTTRYTYHVEIIDIATRTASATDAIPLPPGPQAVVAVTPDGRRAYIARPNELLLVEIVP